MMAAPSDQLKTLVLANCRDVDRRLGFLPGLRKDFEFGKLIMLPFPLELLPAPCAQDDIEAFGKPFLRVVPVIAEDDVFGRMHAPPRAEIETAARKLIHHGKLFGDAERVMHR